MTNASSYPPTIDVLCADGNWDFSINTSSQKLTRTTPNPTGKDEMNYRKYQSGVTYVCRTPFYHENSAWGDNEDAFDLTFNNVFSPKSNPRNTSSTSFTIEVTGTNTIQFYFSSPYDGSPSKPQNLQVVSNGSHPVVSWDANTEPDLSGYTLYRSDDNGPFHYVANLSKYTTSYVDNNVTFTKPIWEVKLVYKVKAKDTQNIYSVYSNSNYIYGDPGVAWKRNVNNNDGKEIVANYELNQSYPNPFNPTTQINYQIPKDGFVNLVVYNTLGQIVSTLVNEQQTSGKYSVQFNASNLPSGIYFYKIESGNFTKVNKMLLLR